MDDQHDQPSTRSRLPRNSLDAARLIECLRLQVAALRAEVASLRNGESLRDDATDDASDERLGARHDELNARRHRIWQLCEEEGHSANRAAQIVSGVLGHPVSRGTATTDLEAVKMLRAAGISPYITTVAQRRAASFELVALQGVRPPTAARYLGCSRDQVLDDVWAARTGSATVVPPAGPVPGPQEASERPQTGSEWPQERRSTPVPTDALSRAACRVEAVSASEPAQRAQRASEGPQKQRSSKQRATERDWVRTNRRRQIDVAEAASKPRPLTFVNPRSEATRSGRTRTTARARSAREVPPS